MLLLYFCGWNSILFVEDTKMKHLHSPSSIFVWRLVHHSDAVFVSVYGLLFPTCCVSSVFLLTSVILSRFHFIIIIFIICPEMTASLTFCATLCFFITGKRLPGGRPQKRINVVQFAFPRTTFLGRSCDDVENFIALPSALHYYRRWNSLN